MPRVCSVCQHPERAEIDTALVSQPLRTIADHFHVSKSALIRHKSHIAGALQAAHEGQDLASAESILAALGDLRGRALAILKTAEGEGALRLALAALKECRAQLQTTAELLTAQDLESRLSALEKVAAQVGQKPAAGEADIVFSPCLLGEGDEIQAE